jgi:putative glutamine amidotransferase
MIVAVFCGREPAHRFSLHRGYVDAVWATGATPMVVPPAPSGDPSRVIELLGHADAVLFAGGGDVGAHHYGAGAEHPLMDVDDDRDRTELFAARWALDTGRRVLGVCRGAQLVNVVLGGDLVPDLPQSGFHGHWNLDRQGEPVHPVSADPGTGAAMALAGRTEVNSIHHQAVGRIGDGLRATAWSPDGVVEALEGDGVLGVQWHPERLVPQDPRHLAAFRWLAGAA